jgi:hypothetical protein
MGGGRVETRYVITAKAKKRNGRHEETRTPDLYRVKRFLLITINNLTRLPGLPKYK